MVARAALRAARAARTTGGAGQLTVDPGKARVGDLVLVSVKPGSRRPREGRAAAREARRRPGCDRGADARPGPAPALRADARARGGRRGRVRRAAERPGARAATCATLATFTIDPTRGQGLRRRDLRGAASRTARIRVWVHIADVSAFVARRLAGRPGGPPAGDERLRPGRGRADAAAGALQRGLLARAGRGPPGRDRRARLRRRAGRRASFYRSVIRSDERLDYERVDRIFAGAERGAGAVGRAAGGGRARPPAGCAAERGAAGGRWRSSAASRSSRSTARATSSTCRAASRPSRTG